MIRPSLRRASAALAVVIGLAVAVVAVPTTAAAAEVECQGDTCDGHRWEAARDTSYWGMVSGHNCTNYVAWRLIGDGVAQPTSGLGNATDWASRAATAGFAVDDVPEIGAVAQWSGFEGGYSELGHVAYVEEVRSDGTLLVSEDSWGGGFGGPLTYRTVPVASVPRFIHFTAGSMTLNEVAVASARWTAFPTEARILSDHVAGVSVADVPHVVYTRAGSLFEAVRTENGWKTNDTRLKTTATEFSAVDIGRGTPYVAAIEEGQLVILAGGWGGWQRVLTGIQVTGHIAAFADGQLLPGVLISQDGWLLYAWNDAQGWQLVSTGIQVDGPVRVVSPWPGRIEVFSVAGGTLHRASYEHGQWFSEDTGLAASSVLDVTTAAGRTFVIVAQDGGLAVATRSGMSWVTNPLGIPAGSNVIGLDLGGPYPVVLQTGMPSTGAPITVPVKGSDAGPPPEVVVPAPGPTEAPVPVPTPTETAVPTPEPTEPVTP